MARKLRIEYEGALYHVLNRGNYRRDLFETVGAAKAFLAVLEEGSAMFNWRVHAYVLMRNHYHLALETPLPNLVEGMHWLQGTIATRFNRFRQEQGHLFQGRYHAILLEDRSVLSRVVDYIHLNPVRARIVEASAAMTYRWSSLGPFIKANRFSSLVACDWLTTLGLTDDDKGWKRYLAHLVELAGSPDEQKRLGFASLSKGWAIGTLGWRKAVARDHAHRALSPGIEAAQKRELAEARWRKKLEELLASSDRSYDQLLEAPKGAPWKVQLARQLRQEEGTSIAWIAPNLHMGKPGAVRSYLSRARAGAFSIADKCRVFSGE